MLISNELFEHHVLFLYWWFSFRFIQIRFNKIFLINSFFTNSTPPIRRRAIPIFSTSVFRLNYFPLSRLFHKFWEIFHLLPYFT